MNSPKAVTQRYFQTNLKDIDEPVEVTLQSKGANTIRTIGWFFPNRTGVSVVNTPDGYTITVKK